MLIKCETIVIRAPRDDHFPALALSQKFEDRPSSSKKKSRTARPRPFLVPYLSRPIRIKRFVLGRPGSNGDEDRPRTSYPVSLAPDCDDEFPTVRTVMIAFNEVQKSERVAGPVSKTVEFTVEFSLFFTIQ